MSEVPWKRLHPASVLVNLVPRAWRVVRSAWPLFLALLYGGSTNRGGFLDMTLVLTFFGLTVGSSVVHYLTLRYRVSEGRLEIITGLMNRQVRVIDPRRIQNVERVRNVFQRAAGLVEVKIETASGTEIEGALSALSEAEAGELIDALQAARAVEPDTEETPGEVLLHNSVGDLLRYGATATRLGAGAAVAFGLAVEGMQFLDPSRVEEVSGFFSGGRIALIGLAVVSGTWVIGTATAVLRHYDFRLVRVGDRLVASEGLLTNRRIELRQEKIQIVTVREPWLRRWIGFGSIHVETAAAREESGGTVSAEAVLPVVEQGRVEELLRHALPSFEAGTWRRELHRPHPHALRRRLVGGTIRACILAAVLTWWLWPWGLLGVLAVPFTIWTAWLDHRHQGWLLTDRLVVARQGYLDRRTAILPRDKIQSLEVHQGWLRRRWGLGVLTVRVAGSAVTLPDVAWEEALELQATLVGTFR